MNNFSDVVLFVTAEDADVRLSPEALAVCPNKVLLECEGESDTAALKAPKAVVVLEEVTAEELPNPENPEVPKPLAASEVLNEKEAADGAAGLPKPTEWDTLGEDVTPNAGRVEPADELPKAGVLPDDALTRLELVLKEKLLALLLLLFTGKPASIKFIKSVRMCVPVIPNHCCISIKKKENNSRKCLTVGS